MGLIRKIREARKAKQAKTKPREAQRPKATFAPSSGSVSTARVGTVGYVSAPVYGRSAEAAAIADARARGPLVVKPRQAGKSPSPTPSSLRDGFVTPGAAYVPAYVPTYDSSPSYSDCSSSSVSSDGGSCSF